jgi:hypothetical protein
MEKVVNLTKEDIQRLDSLPWQRVEEGLPAKGLEELYTLYVKRDYGQDVLDNDPVLREWIAKDAVRQSAMDWGEVEEAYPQYVEQGAQDPSMKQVLDTNTHLNEPQALADDYAGQEAPPYAYAPGEEMDPRTSHETAWEVVHELRYDYHQMLRAAQNPSRYDAGRIEPTVTGPNYHMTDEPYSIWGHSPETEAVVTLEIVAELQAHGYQEDAIIVTPHGDFEQVALGVPAHERTEDPELRTHLQDLARDVAQGVSATERRAHSGAAVDREAYESREYSPRRAAA